ncbi:DUF4114 domain-containing protein [Microcoleus sp. F6_B6]
MEKFVPGSLAFIKEAANRALSNSTKGYIAINDDLESAYYTDPNSSENLNSGQYLGTKTFAMTPGDKFFFMLVPNGTVQQVYDNPAIGDDKKPLFSIATDNPSDTFSIGQIADITGEGQLFAMEDMGLIQGSDIDYDDITFRVTGATSKIVPLSELVDSFSASIHSQLVQKLKGESDKSEPKFTRESTVTNSGDKSQGETPSITADNDQQNPQPTTATVANSDSPQAQPTATSTVANSDSPQAQPTETSIVGKSDTEESQPTETSTFGKSDTEEAQPTETSTFGKSDTEESQQIEQTASPPETPSVSPTELNSEIELPVLAESLVSESADAELIKTDTTATNRIPQLPAEADYAVNNAASPPTAETLLIPTPIASQPPAKTSEIADNFGEELPRETDDSLPNAASQLPTQITEVIPASKAVDIQEIDRDVTENAAESETEQFPTTAEIIATKTENVADLIEDDTAFPEITAEFETEQLVTKTESIVDTPEADDTVERELPVAEITAEFESQQLPPKTDDFALAEFTADTIDTDIAVTFTAAELETENSPAIVVNSLDTDPLISHSNSSVQTDSPIQTLFSTPSETAAGTAQIASVETSVSPSTLKSPPEPNSNTYNSNSTQTETAAAQPAYSDTEIAPQSADITSGLLPLEAEEPAQFSDGIANIQPNSTQRTGDFQSNTNPPTNLSITTTANLPPIPGTFLVDNQGEVRFDYVFDGGLFEGEVGIFSLAGMSAFTPGTPEFIAEALRRVLSNSTDGHIVISDSIEGAKFTGSMPFDWEWGSGEYQGIKTFNMTPGDTFAVMLVPNGTVQSSLESSYSGNWFPEHRPLFSIANANPNDTSYVLPIADATGTGNTFAMEDMSAANSDSDYNDLIFTVLGATGNAPLLSAVINPDREWRNTTLGQQLIEYANSQVPPETAPPAIAAALVNDTGSNSTDGITNNPAISGTITDASDIASFRASFSRESTGIELKDLLTSDGSFALTPNTLSTVNGNTLTDGTYTLYLLATDSHGNTNTFELPFTLDTTPPELTFGLNPAFDTPPVADGQTLDSTVTLTGQTDPGSTVILAETGAVTTADSTGRFEFAGVTLAIGSNSFTTTATDKAGNESTASRTFTRTSATDSGVIWLAEGTSFTEKLFRPITIPAVPSTLTVNIAGLNFDASDSDSIKDAFEIALVDASGRSLVHTVGTGHNSFFNFTEGQPPQLAAGVTFNGSNISVNLSQIADGTAATLQIRLVNNDSDTATQVGITSIAIQPSSAAIVPVTASPSEDVSPNVPVNFNRLQDVGSSLEAEYKQTSFNSSSKILYADLAVKNAGQYPVRGTLLVGINNISDPTVRLLDADGMTPEGIPYYDISKLVGGGILKPGELTSTDTLKFYNPQGVQFSYDLVFLSQLNQVPQFKATPNTEVLVGKSYVYTAIAIDADGDALTYSLLEKPQGMEIDAQTGIISWPTVAGDIGNHAVTVEVGDGKGGVAKQKYVLSAINPPPNRPPIFTSTPVVDAAVNTPYTYEAIAKDPDSNPLTYSLVSSPAGMSVNPSTGLLTWTPTSDQLGLSDVVLKVTDGQGGTTEQAFKIQIQKEPGNHAPIITSEPETKAYASKGYTYQLSSVDPDFDPLKYSLVAAPIGMTIDQNTGQITWNNLTSSDAGKHEVTVKVKDNRGAVDTQTYTLEVFNVVPGQLKGKVYLDDRQPLNTLVYFNDFEDQNRSKAEWSNPITDVTPIGNRHFLGEYSSISKNNPRGKTSLELNSLPEHDTVTVSFDLYILKSWDGLASWVGGPALWELNVENGPTLLQTTFNNVDFYWPYYGAGQSYPDPYSANSNYPPRTGATENNTLGYSFYGDSVYNLSFTFDHKDSNLLLNFLGNAGNGGLADIGNESWGLDNVEVRASSKGQGLSNWPVYLDSNGNNKRDLSEQFTLTDEQGNYSFTLESGNYTVAQELPTGWTKVVPTGNTYQVGAIRLVETRKGG